MLYPEIPKSKRKPTYIGGGIFALLIGAPCLVLFLPPFLLSFGIVLWDWNNVGLNWDYLVFAAQWGALILGGLLLLVNFVGLFIGVSRSSFFFKLSGLLFVASFFVKYGLWFIEDISPMDIITMSVAGAGVLALLLGIIFRVLPSERKNPKRAPSFLMFYAVFWLLVAGVELLASSMLIVGLTESLEWFFLESLGLFGVIGGLWMIVTSRRRQEKNTDTVQPAMQGFAPMPPTAPAGYYAPQSTPQTKGVQSKLSAAQPNNQAQASGATQNISTAATPKATSAQASGVNQNITPTATPKGTPAQAQPLNRQPGVVPPFPGQAPRFVPPFPPRGLPPRIPNLPPKLPPKKEGDK